MHRLASLIILGFIFFCQSSFAFSQDITLIYTGESHASLYPCHCPGKSDGGLMRRATKIKQIRKENKNVLLVDSGGFFAGGPLDSHSLNTELDKLRTQITLKAMDKMDYDAVAIGDEEFNFGKEFLLDEISKTKISFLSSNIKSKDFFAYTIKKIAGVKFAILALTPGEAHAKSGLEIVEAKRMLPSTIAKAKKEGADIIVVLSHLGDDIDAKLAEEIKGLDIIIAGQKIINRKEPYSQIGSSLLLRPHWEARALGRCDLKIENKKVVDFKVEQIRLSSELKDDPAMKKIVPVCFSDKDCRKSKLKGKCISPATIKARCEFSEPNKIDVSVIRPKETMLPYDTENTIKVIKRFLPNVDIKYIDYPSRKAKRLIKKLKVKTLPAYILPEKVKKESSFSKMEVILDKKDKFYLVRPFVSGVSLFIGRKRIENRLDVFLTLKEKNIDELLEVLKEFIEKHKDRIDFHIHFVAFFGEDGFDTPAGSDLIEEYLRQVCVMHYYPLRWWDYVVCRAKDVTSSWWDACLENMDFELIRSDARSKKGEKLLKENIRLTEELEISNSPAFLFENQEVFSTEAIPTIEDLEGVILGGVE